MAKKKFNKTRQKAYSLSKEVWIALTRIPNHLPEELFPELGQTWGLPEIFEAAQNDDSASLDGARYYFGQPNLKWGDTVSIRAVKNKHSHLSKASKAAASPEHKQELIEGTLSMRQLKGVMLMLSQPIYDTETPHSEPNSTIH